MNYNYRKNTPINFENNYFKNDEFFWRFISLSKNWKKGRIDNKPPTLPAKK
jgi:hypothetical protein